MKKIFISTTTFAQLSDAPIELLKSKGYQIKFNKLGRKLSKEEISGSISEFNAILAGTEIFNKSVLAEAKCLQVISRLGIGLDNIDLKYAKEKNIKIFKTNTTPALAVAELTLGLILDLSRKISLQNHQLKSKIWEKKTGFLFREKTLGIIGLGNIGKNLVKLTKGFNLNYIAYDKNQDNKFAAENNIKYNDLDILLGYSDVVSIHLNLTEETHNLIGYDQLKKMKSSAILINTSRGEIVNEPDLEKAIKENIIAGVGLDVFINEPYQGSLLQYDNVVLTPHIGSYAKEIRVAMEFEAAQNIIKGLEE